MLTYDKAKEGEAVEKTATPFALQYKFDNTTVMYGQ